MKVRYSCCFKLQILNLIDQESFLSAPFLFSRAHLLSSKLEDKLLVNLLWTCYAPASAEHWRWEMRQCILLTATLHTEGRTCALPAQLALHSPLPAPQQQLPLHEPLTSCTKGLFHTKELFLTKGLFLTHVFALSCGNTAMMVCCSWLEFWGILTHGLVLTRTNMSAKDIDWIHSSSISHHLFIMNTLVSIWPIGQ